MVQILTLVGAAALLAQTAFGAAVPVKRTNHENNNYNNQEASNQYSNQDSNQYGGNAYNQQYNQDSYQNGNAYNQYQNGNAYEATTTALAQTVHETTTVMHETTTATAEMVHETTTTMEHETSTVEAASTETSMAHETTTTEMVHETSSVEAQETSTAEYTMPTYGSGSSSWNNNGYNNCVSQCMAQFGAPPSTVTHVNQDSLPSATGTGVVHTVLVAPTGAGLRYMPFAVNATVGDTIRYVWTTAANHTATLSSALAICNKSGIAESRNFVSGVKNAADGTPQVFDVTVETDQPQFFYCSVAQHCAKGMFGIINPGNNQAGANVGSLMNQMIQENPGLQAAYNYAQQNISSSTAKNWGMAMSLDGIPESAYADVAANDLFTQATFAANEGMLETGLGATTPDGSPVMVPDLNILLSNANAAAPTTPGAAFSSSPSAPVAAATGSITPVNAYGNGASKSTVGVWVAAVVGIAGWLLI